MRAVLALLLLALGSLTGAKEPPERPLLRVETGMHTTLIRRIVVDAPRNRLITCADDKTIRVWQMPGMRLIATLRVPIDEAHEGQLFGLAVSPDGSRVAAGGWTGWDWQGQASIYVFDIASNDLAQRLGGFRDAIHALAWSPDGNHLAVGLQGRAGLDLVRLGDGKVIASDTQYRDKLTELHFASNGRLAAVALDGMVRLYDGKLRLLGRRKTSGGDKPVSVRFSPDGQRLALGFADAPAVSVLSARDLEFEHAVDTGGIGEQASFLSVTWSSDGQYLYAGGDYRGPGMNPLYRWAGGGRGKPEAIPVAANRISEIQQLPEGRIAFAAEDPGFGIVGPSGLVEGFRGPDLHDFSQAHGQLLLSEDGGAIGYPARRDNSLRHGFAVFGGGEQSPAAPEPATVAGPLLAFEGFVIEDWRNGLRPRINGKVPQLDDYEMGRSYAFSPDGGSLLLGTEWALRLFDREAREMWRVKLAAVAWAVNVSGNGRVAVTALSDGTLRWYRMSDGQELFAYFPHRNGQDWIAWLPDGHYLSSVHGDNFVGWHLNRGQDATPDFYRAVQFDRVLYRPDLFRAAARTALLPDLALPAGAPASASFDINRIEQLAPPRLRLRATGVSQVEQELRLRLRLQGEGGAQPARDVVIFVNGIPVTPASERRLAQESTAGFSREFDIPLISRENEIRAESFNGLSMGVAELFLALPGQVQTRPRPGDLYLLAVGVNDFPELSAEASLAYATRDAEILSRVLAQQAGGQFRTIRVKLITDASAEKPNRRTIIDALDFLQQAQGNDTVALFLASHGISDAAGNYYFVPRDAKPGDIERIIEGGEIESLLPWTLFFDALRATSGRRLLIVDTCQARNIEGRFEAHSLMKRSAASQFSLMLASKGNEESQELPAARHGLFTYSLLQAMQPGADRDRDGALTLHEWFDGAVAILERERDKATGPQTPQLIVPPALNDLSLIRLDPKADGRGAR